MLLKNAVSLLAASAVGVAAVRHQHSHSKLQRRQNETVSVAAAAAAEYDYIVVGSGAGGGPLAARLAVEGFSVLVLEAGDDVNDVFTKVPALHFASAEHRPMAWNYYVNHYPDLEQQRRDSKMTWKTPEGDTWVQLLNGTTPPAGSEPLGILYPRAGVVGGCTQHHAQIMVYPHASDFQGIVDATGDTSWAPDNMRNYFKKLERAQYLNSVTGGHGFNGWLSTSLTDLTLIAEDLKFASLIFAAGAAMGRGIITSLLGVLTGLGSTLAVDLNNPSAARDTTEGMYQVPLSINAGEKTRSGPRNWLYQVINDGYDLTIQTQTLATKITFDTTGAKPRATGVEYLRGQSLYRADPRAPRTGSPGVAGSVTARREVIISAGTFNTPQLLKLSGVGPASELAKFGIPQVVELPGVGTNMMDRYEAPTIGRSSTPFPLTKDCTFQTSQPDPCLDRYNNPSILGRGVYGTSGAAFAVLDKSSTNTDRAEPDLFTIGYPADFRGYFEGYSRHALRDKNHWSWVPLKAHTRNRAGTVRLRSSDPRDTPLIDFNYFNSGTTAGGADEKDLQAVVDGLKFGREAFAKLVDLSFSGGFAETSPGKDIKGDAALKQYVKDEAWGHHASCTCPIGADGDPKAVLDSKFRVRGTEGLRVVDASVFPSIPGYFIALPIYMVAEKAADVIAAAAFLFSLKK